MTATNHQLTGLKALDQDRKVVATTYTIRTGRVTDGLQIDNPIDVTDPAANFTLTLPSGYKMGQQQLVVMSSNSDSKTCSLSVTNHETSDPEVFTLDAADEYWLGVWTGTEWATISTTATT